MRSLTNFKRFAPMLFCFISVYSYGQTERPQYVPGQVLIKMKANKTSTEKNILKNEMQATVQRTRPNSNIEVWQTDKINIDQLISQYRDHPDIEFIEPNYYYYLTTKNYTKTDGQAATTPDDALFPDLWNMDNIGQNGGTTGADINAQVGWDIATASPSVVVGLIDSGVDWKHPDLVNNIWQNLGEDADGDGRVLEWNGTTWIFDPDDTDGIDGDGNGYIDDLIGWDFINDDNDPFDLIGHGTHVAGTLGAEGNNGIGVAGVTWDVQIAALRVFAQQNTSVDIIAEALDYAVMMNMPISNNSYAEGHYAQTMITSLQAAEANGHLFVAAAGNFANDNDANPHYPSSYDFDNIISVAATDHNDLLWAQSPNTGASYGLTNVDIAAPGAIIKSTLPGNNYGYNTGTSMATPHVTGACALLWEQNSGATYGEIKTAILNSADILPDLSGKCVSEGRLNLYGALTYSNTTPPAGCRYDDSLTLVTLYNATNGANWTNTWDLSQPMDGWFGIRLDENGCVICIDMDGDFNCDYVRDAGNNLAGNIPPELANLTQLTYLGLSDNPLTGSIPPELGSLTNLQELRLYNNNQLTGTIPPELGNLGNLTHLALSSDLITGTIPIELANLSNLKHLFLEGNNELTGNIPPELANLSNLEWLYLHNNALTGNIPPELGNLSNLKRLAVSYNDQLSGSIPPEIGSLSNLEQLYFNDCQLTGSIPPELGNLSKLIYLYADNNQLTGNIPPELGNLSNLIRLYLSINQLTGSIPPEFCNLSNLERMSLFMNNLSGCYDECLTILCSQLGTYSTNARVSNGNNFDASWEDFCNTGAGTCSPYALCRQSDSLALVALYNSTNGANWTNTWNLNLPIDTWYGVTLNGEGCVSCLDMDGVIDCNHFGDTGNNLVGTIPPELGNLTSLTWLGLAFNELSGNIPPELGNLTTLVTGCNLSHNPLTGNIPPELGNLINLENLSLNNCQLNGSIPAEIGNMTNLIYLFIHDNQLGGCYDENLLNLCNQLLTPPYNTNTYISDGNNFNADWEDFCATGVGRCGLVWPGDYNYDGIANLIDALYWGLAYGNMGSARTNASTAWQGQSASDWGVNVKSVNGKHQDGNGDGTIDGDDLPIVIEHFGNIHTQTQSVYIASTMIYELVEAGPVGGDPSYDLYVTDANGANISAHGLSGMIEFGGISIDEIILRVDNYSLEPSDTLKVLETGGNRFHFALTRTDRVDQICDGPIANFIVVTQDIPVGDPFEISVANGNTVQANGNRAKVVGTTLHANYHPNIASNDLVVGASVIHETCNIPGSVTLSVEGGTPPYSYVWNTGATSSNITGLTPNIYEVTVTDMADTSRILSVEVQGEYINIPDASGNLPDCINSPCPTLVTPSGDIPAGIYKADTAVNSDGTVNGNVEFKAGETIILREGFEVPTNTNFSGTIESCSEN